MTTDTDYIVTGNGLYRMVTPMFRAGDKDVDKRFAESLREFLYRNGVNVSSITDDELVRAAREGVESRYKQPLSKGGRK